MWRMNRPSASARWLAAGLSTVLLSPVLLAAVFVAAVFVVSGGCLSTTAIPESHGKNEIDEKHGTKVNEQLDQQWREQFARVLAGESDTLLLDSGPITAEQLAELSQLDGKLTQLLIDAGGVDDTALPSIAKVHSLVHLRLRESDISDQGLASLVAAGLPELQILNIPQGRIGARGIVSLAALPKLVQLRLGGKQLDDGAVAELAKLPKLRSLHLIGPDVTDAALRELAACPLLTSFYLDDCPLSDAAWEELFAAKSNLHVHVDQAHHDRDPKRH